jgi:hypothetical protein
MVCPLPVSFSRLRLGVFLALATLGLVGCVEPSLGLGMSITPNGVHVTPTVRTGVPGVSVAVTR